VPHSLGLTPLCGSNTSVTEHTSIAEHLIHRFHELKVRESFGIVGDFALKLFSELTDHGFPVLVTTDEQGAGFAADAYARLNGFGVVALTYGAGGLKVANAAANAWAEQVPLLILSGAPGVAERAGDPMLHHKVKDFDTQLRVFSDLTCAQAVLTDPHTAANEIDRVISTMISEQRPGYIEVPRDLIGVAIAKPDGQIIAQLPRVDEHALAEAVADVLQDIAGVSKVVIHAGAMVQRRGLEQDLFSLATSAGIPVATSSLARGVFPERHELGLGLYLGAVSTEAVRQRVEGADVVMSLGVLQTDLTLGAFTANIDHARLILCTDTDVTVGYRTYRDVPLWAFLPALAQAVSQQTLVISHDPIPLHGVFTATDLPLTVERTVAAIESHVDERHGLLLDPGEALFSSVDMRVPVWALGSAYYATMGYAVPGALGAGKARPNIRPVVVVGDGAFAMTGLEVAALAFHQVPAVVIVFDNQGYGTQRPILDGVFNDIPPMAVEKLVAVIGSGRGHLVHTEVELDDALKIAMNSNELNIIRVILPKGGRSAGLNRLGAALAKRV
jgi:TPP-dependent 2-oxoacid decarboxylase